MVKKHPVFKAPNEDDQKIWRYLDFTKFVDLLITESLFFSRVDLFEDIFEGSNPKMTVSLRNAQMLEFVNRKNMKNQFIPEFYQDFGLKEKTNNAVNCWHMNDFESAAMWNLYIQTNEGIAIQSTYRKLVDNLNESDLSINVGIVNYINYDKDIIGWGNGFLPYVHKRKSFEHEKELRALIWKKDNKEKVDFSSGGVKVKVNIPSLIENVYVSPNSSIWFTHLVKEITKKIGYNLNIINSSLNENPIY